jgi:hypothetical protein
MGFVPKETVCLCWTILAPILLKKSSFLTSYYILGIFFYFFLVITKPALFFNFSLKIILDIKNGKNASFVVLS